MAAEKKAAVFEKVRLDWKGREHVIAADSMMMAIAVVEDRVSLPELAAMYYHGPIKFSKLAQGYAALLRYAGAEVTDEEVFRELFPAKSADVLAEALAKLYVLLKLMTPPEFLVDKDAKQAAAGAEEASSRLATSSSSAPPSVH